MNAAATVPFEVILETALRLSRRRTTAVSRMIADLLLALAEPEAEPFLAERLALPMTPLPAKPLPLVLFLFLPVPAMRNGPLLSRAQNG
jgi:hypothetical protein